MRVIWCHEYKGKTVSDAKTEYERQDWIEGKERRLEVLNEAPLVLATPVHLLAGQRITDKQVLFVCSIHDLAEGHTLEPRSIEGWEIELAGLIDPSRVVVHAEELLEMDQVESEMVLQCSGNGPGDVLRHSGHTLDQGGVANVRFTGVPLSAVLEKNTSGSILK
jgi:DMSO/TMAO reductase YedYZ molybdopterin-dependent catalytic subunit